MTSGTCWILGAVAVSVIALAVIKTNERIDRCAAYGKAHSVTTKFDSKTSYCLAKSADGSWAIVSP